jgi:hypothetical protein
MAYDTRQIISVVTDALIQQAAREMGEDANNLPLFVELEGHVRSIVPSVQTIYDTLATVERIWQANGADLILDATDANAVPLGQGTVTASQWHDYQRLFKALNEWIMTPVTLSTDPQGTTPGPVPIVVISRRKTV